MTRLTNTLRQDIVHSLVKWTFRVRSEDLVREEEPLAFALRDEFLGEYRDIYLGLPGRLRESSASITVIIKRHGKEQDRFDYHFHPEIQLKGTYDGGVWQGPANVVGMQEEPEGNIRGIMGEDIPKALLTKIQKHADKYDAFVADIKEFEVRISDQLRACTTTEKLVKQWPEVEQHLPAAMNPLTVQIDRVKTNKLIACMEKGTCK
jgi:hypothetical protein